MSFYPLFSLGGLADYVEVLNILDGDTISVIIPISLEFGNGKNEKKGLYRLNIRLLGIDTPELKNKETTVAANNSKDRLISLIDECNKKVYLKLHHYDKYGRILGEIFKDSNCEISFNQILINEGLAKPYFGGKKPTH